MKRNLLYQLRRASIHVIQFRHSSLGNAMKQNKLIKQFTCLAVLGLVSVSSFSAVLNKINKIYLHVLVNANHAKLCNAVHDYELLLTNINEIGRASCRERV